MNTTERIIIMVDNEVGVLAGITSVLAGAGINVESMNTQTAGDRGAVIMTVDNTDHALAVLNQAGYKAVSDDAVVVRLRDEPGALARVADGLKTVGREYPEPAHPGQAGRLRADSIDHQRPGRHRGCDSTGGNPVALPICLRGTANRKRSGSG